MKTFLIVLAILILLGIVVFLLIRKPEKVVDDNSIVVPDSGSVTEPGSDADIDEDIEVHIPEHCKIDKCNEVLPNKYFFNVHKYTTAKNRIIYCVVCNAVIKGKNYKVIVANSYYPYIGSYTKNLCAKIVSKYTDTMTVEEFLKTGSTKFDRVGVIIDGLPYIF